MKPGKDPRDELVSELWAERHNGIAWKLSRREPRPAPPTRTSTAHEITVPWDDDITIARRRRELLAAAVEHHPITESEAT